MVPWGPLSRIVTASAIMGLAVLTLGRVLDFPAIINLAVKVCFGVLIYFGILIFLKEIDIQDIVRSMSRRRNETV